MRLRAIVRPRRAATWLARAGVALSVPTLGAPLIGCTSVLTIMAGVALTQTLGLDPTFGEASVVGGILVGLATAIGVGRHAAHSWNAAGRLLEDAGALAIGADGVRWSSRERGDCFVRWSEVERVDEEPTLEDELGTLVLVLRDAEPIRFFVEDSAELASDAQRALDAYRAATVERVVDLEPNGRDVRTWITDVKRLLRAGTGTYRAGAVSAERLIAIATAPAAPRVQRIGAAVSLSRAPEPLRAKVRVALTDTADDELRDVMESALDGRDLDARAVARALAAR
ncbi:hypothetical protein [Sandaracinus amylolyticus]|uniref:hypothetical protein n=1 Tax=Sandaracinus amylolyticus TaxID=927083 RepID=UPI001F46DFC8|nr:hypothetical protein [Sandaracinus amylolyticus]UJR82689.1 Hypothetical protein I5071_47540 [Sandaracinus amylolyticus]